MDELLRQNYLDVLGVNNYYPRIALPGAKASVLCEMPIFTKIPALVEKQQPAPKAKRLNVNELFESENVGTKRVAAAVNKEISNKTTSPAANIPHFTLSIVSSAGGGPLIIDSALGMENNQQDYLQLLHNLLFALGFGKQQLSFEQFRWPLITKTVAKTTSVDQSEIAARQTLEAFVCRQLTQSSSQTILLMGDVAANYFTESVWPQGKLSQYSPASCTLIRTVSAVAMLNEPALKRQAWYELQALVQYRRSQSSTDA